MEKGKDKEVCLMFNPETGDFEKVEVPKPSGPVIKIPTDYFPWPLGESE